MTNKIARLTIPREKIELCGKIWTNWFANQTTGSFTATYLDGDFVKDEKIFIIEGDSDIINPVVTQLMQVLEPIRNWNGILSD